MASETTIGLTLRDLAILVDGTGNIPDETARRLAPLSRQDERVAENLRQLQQMADDAQVVRLEDGLTAFEILQKLRETTWKSPREVTGPDLEIPYRELIAMSKAMTRRVKVSDRKQFAKLTTRLEAWFSADLASEDCFQEVVRRLRSVPVGIANRAIDRLSKGVKASQPKDAPGETSAPL